MRFEGTLVQWNDERGFGFVQPAQGGEKLFVHASAFARDGRRPQLNERLGFAVAPGQNGKKQAVAVQRLGAAAGARPPSRTTPRPAQRSPSTGRFGRLVALLLVCALLAAGYWKYGQSRRQQAQAAAASLAQPPGTGTGTAAPRGRSAAAAAPAAPVASPYRCDGRQYCAQMTSCAEAKFFLKNCPDPRMDGNHDGVPCEQQWCTGPLGN